MPDSAFAEPGVAEFKRGVDEDWDKMAAGLRQRQQQQQQQQQQQKPKPTKQPKDDDPDDSSDDDSDGEGKKSFDREDEVLCGRKFWISFAAFILAALIFGAYQVYLWMNPVPVSCSLELARPQKFKVDVTDFFAPKVSAAVQFVVSLKNGNMLRSMLLEQCKLTAFETETGLKLGSVHQGSLVLSPFSSTQVTVSLQGLASGLPPPEQRRLAALFLAKVPLLLTIVATASSRLPVKGSKAAQETSNSTRKLDYSALTKEPFFQRAAPPPEATAEPTVHDVPL